MKRTFYIFLSIIFLSAINACQKSSLDLSNPNEPGLAALKTEEGIKRAGLGIYDKFGSRYWWYTLNYHDIMGDTYFSSVGNFSFRWTNQVSAIKLSNGTTLTPPQGGSQITELRNRNDRSFTTENVFYNEWLAMYLVNNQANLILLSLEDKALQFSGNADARKNTLKAWAYWWKGFTYSRLGSIYIGGIITNEFGKSNNTFVTRQQLIEEANKNFDAAVTALKAINTNATADYRDVINAVLPSFANDGGKGSPITPDHWIRHINTYKARNILVNKTVGEMTNADWTAIQTLTADGIRPTDRSFIMRSAEQNDLVGQISWQPYRSMIQWTFISERLIQDFKAGDKRKDRNFKLAAKPIVNNQGRGFQYSTRWEFIPVESGGDYSSTVIGAASITVACSYEENTLMQAEAAIKLGQVEDGLKLIDAVRTFQRAGLPAVAGAGLTAAQAYDELRIERRIALINKNVSFYDARRWGVVKPLANGGGRKGAVVLGPNGVLDTNATIDYNYLSYWDVPLNEIDFNPPGSGSAPVTGN
ncbi:MAG TPA: RagB/SusD family nutrient uptake outer membrane protein [Chitinophaga sp.]|uniref:RagB/SusD family nutrient uptake outer membrane protein n=1 Tax=Chitinophaga sp. TaxID=1869181 RepID=UPI002CC3BB86|nr:RagB/SusD family nutrient uptake outer membrane protein [Chitinophaga sp.]HVI43522.1 RagB/SusD family nutrient uptake outer membrane protein [Chitinophaga sp.]